MKKIVSSDAVYAGRSRHAEDYSRFVGSAEAFGFRAIYNERTFFQAFCRDLKKAKKRVIIESPYLTERHLASNL